MQANLSITFRNMDTSPSVEAHIRHRAAELEQFSDRISACRVTLEATHRHHRQGTIYRVSVDLSVPGGKVVVNREPAENHAHEDMHVAIRDAFDAARRRLQDRMRRMDGTIKQHEAPSIGRITGLFAARGYGFLATENGEEIYLHCHSVIGGAFRNLKVGDRVRYVVDPGEGNKGAQASTVVPLD
jgi:ribosomal subunit interface protein